MYSNEQNDDNIQKHIPQPDPALAPNESYSNTEKDPDEWITGAEPMTGAQKSYLKTLSDEAGEEFDENLSKAAASKRIEELQHKTGRGLSDQNK
ncbi:MAG: DUF3072 domain-containing protein [Parafilimonas sp.]|nr:DUF3072 domain-containing protein [Parafilimonas sp.]